MSSRQTSQGSYEPRPPEGHNVSRTGYMKKMKTGRRKWFVLRRETSEAQARLEYYDSEKKYQSGVAPRKVILLKTCFNINLNRTPEGKHKYVIALYTKDECLQLAIEDEGEAEEWFKDLLLMQQGEELAEGETPRPTFAHVWEVDLVNRGLGGTQDLIGNYRLCLRERTLSLIRKDYPDYGQIEVQLSSIRSCGSLQKYVFFEVGRSCAIGPGELWMLTEDQNIAQNVHSTVYHAMTKNKNDDLGPKSRIRSSSATETSKPNANKKLHSKSHIFSQGITSGGRERCDSMPSRARTASEGNHPIPMYPGGGVRSHRPPGGLHHQYHHHHHHSPPVGSPISPPSAAASTDSAGSSFSLVDETDDLDSNLGGGGRYGHSLTPDEAIAEEDCDSLCVPYGLSPNTGNYVPMAGASSDDGYVDMSPKGRHGNVTPAASLSSVTSGTPSTDLRFAEYQLDKVMSFFPPSSDDESRPIRAYSVGSRPETYRYKKHLMELPGMAENRRDRAASVGSKTKKGPIRVLPPHGHYPQVHPKSSSAPILNAGRMPGSSSSVGSEMDDLMEMDFTNHKKRSFDGYLEMKPGCAPAKSTTPMSIPVTTYSGYVEMKPGVIPPNMTGPYVEMRPPGSSPNNRSTTDYTCMDMSRNSNLPHNNTDYMDMNAKKQPNNNNNNNYGNLDFTETNNHYQPHHQPNIKRSYSQLSPSYFKSNSPSDYVDMRRNEGYVEMTLGKGHQRQSSLDSKDTSMKSGANRSLPIQILNNTNQGTYARMDSSPKMQLQLTNTASPSSSLPRGGNSRKNSTRRDSRDSSSSTVTTPSNSSTIFPLSLNSPSSPVKPPVKTPERSTPAVLLNNLYKRIRGKSNETQDDYTAMDFQKKPPPNDVYVNLDMTKGLNERLTDYAEMRVVNHPQSDATKSFGMLTLTEGRTFRPIEEVGVVKSSRSDSVESTRPGSASSDLCSSTSTLVGSRPDSVNSGGDGAGAARPASASTLHYANLDLQAIDDDGDDDGDAGAESKKSPKGDAGAGSFSYAEIDFKNATAS